ncbi:MAG: hypothetical protein MZU95_08480 [Desulfomicrobium escambiense]|nr:hypothetical protein [Desulfomicrobium escambiense]
MDSFRSEVRQAVETTAAGLGADRTGKQLACLRHGRGASPALQEHRVRRGLRPSPCSTSHRLDALDPGRWSLRCRPCGRPQPPCRPVSAATAAVHVIHLGTGEVDEAAFQGATSVRAGACLLRNNGIRFGGRRPRRRASASRCRAAPGRYRPAAGVYAASWAPRAGPGSASERTSEGLGQPDDTDLEYTSSAADPGFGRALPARRRGSLPVPEERAGDELGVFLRPFDRSIWESRDPPGRTRGHRAMPYARPRSGRGTVSPAGTAIPRNGNGAPS